MVFDKEAVKYITSIYKSVYKQPEILRNVLKKNLVKKAKLIPQSKFNAVLESLVALGTIKIDKEKITLSPEIVTIGVLNTDGKDFYVVTPNSKNKYKINKSVAAGYKPGDVLDIITSTNNQENYAIILGRSQKDFTQKPSNSKKYSKFSNSELLDETCLLGRVIKLSYDDLVFIPNEKSFPIRQIPILNNKDEYSSFQDKICIIKLKDIAVPGLGGEIISVKGDAGNPIHEYDAIAESYGAIMSWNNNAIIEDEITQIPTEVKLDESKLINEQQAISNQSNHIVDLRHLPFVTVDPATCKDMDDAIYSTFDEDGNFVCYTAVANVTKYVDINSEIFKRYVNAGFTLYAPNKAYNILPTKLSTGICSLNPDEDRLAFVVKTVIDNTTGKAKESRIYDAVIRSKQKYSYEQAQEIIDAIGVDDEVKDYLQYKYAHGEQLSLEEQIYMNFLAAQKIKFGFDQRKMIRFTGEQDREIIFDKDLKDVTDIKIVPHLLYHEVIEAFMITANEATAEYASENHIDNIYRIHEKPNPTKSDKASEFFDIMGIDFDRDLSAQSTRAIIELIKGSTKEEIVNNFLIKMQSRAIYSNKLYSEKPDETYQPDEIKISHYALQSPHYSHTTSPIRRVPDFITQYNILANIHGYKPLDKEYISKIIEIANERQIDIDHAEQEFQDISSVIYSEKHIGEKLQGRITKIRQSSIEEGYEDDIVVIVKNYDKGICAEIPLSQILGRPTNDCYISKQHCAVYDGRGNIVVTLCNPIEFIIEKADRKTMTIVGRTNKTLSTKIEQPVDRRKRYTSAHYTEKSNRKKRLTNTKKKKNTRPNWKTFGDEQ